MRDGFDLLGDLVALRFCDSLKSIRRQIKFIADQENGRLRTVMADFCDPVFGDIVEGSGRVHRVANQCYVCIVVGKRANLVVSLLSSRIPQRQVDWLSINRDFFGAIFKDCRYIIGFESFFSKSDQETRFSAGFSRDSIMSK